MRGVLLAPSRFLLLVLFVCLSTGAEVAEAKVSPYVSRPRLLPETQNFLENTRAQVDGLDPTRGYRILRNQLQAFVTEDHGPQYLLATLRLALEASEGLELQEAFRLLHRALVGVLDYHQSWSCPPLVACRASLAVAYRCLKDQTDPVRIRLLRRVLAGMLEDSLLVGDVRVAAAEVVLAAAGGREARRRRWWQRKVAEPLPPQLDERDTLGLLAALTEALSLEQGKPLPGLALLDIARVVAESRARPPARLEVTRRILARGLEMGVYRSSSEAVVKAAMEITDGLDPQAAVAYLVDALRREVLH